MKMFFAKQGFIFRIIYGIFNVVLLLPISLPISLIINQLLNKFNCSFALISFILVNILWIIRNNIIIVDSNELIIRDLIGKKIIVDMKKSSIPRLITSEEYNKLLSVRTGLQSIISNCFFPFSKKIKVIHFKDCIGRDVIIGAYNIELLNNIIRQNSTDEITGSIIVNSPKERKGLVEYYYVKMPIKNHVGIYFMHFPSTIVLPIILLGCYYVLLKLYGITINYGVWILLYAFTSLWRYSQLLKVTVDRYNSFIKLRIFKENKKNLINIKEIQSMSYNEKYQCDEKNLLLISTPGYEKLNSDRIHIITSYCDIYIALYNAKKFYNILC